MWGETVYTIIDELKFGKKKNTGVWMRLEETEKGRRVIRLWSGQGKTRYWKVMYRYDVDENWNRWKRTHANVQPKRH